MVFKNIISFGLLTFMMINNEPVFILVQRRESIPYILFVTNRLHIIQPQLLESQLDTMTNNEKASLLNNQSLRKDIDKYRHILENKTENLLDWSFPKGKAKRREIGIEIAKREFEEETPFTSRHIKSISQDIQSYSVTGSDNKLYKYYFFPTELVINLKDIANPKDLNLTIPHLTTETSNIGFFGINQITEHNFKKPLYEFIHKFYKENF